MVLFLCSLWQDPTNPHLCFLNLKLIHYKLIIAIIFCQGTKHSEYHFYFSNTTCVLLKSAWQNNFRLKWKRMSQDLRSCLLFQPVGVENWLRSSSSAGKEGRDATLEKNNRSTEFSCICTTEYPPSVGAGKTEDMWLSTDTCWTEINLLLCSYTGFPRYHKVECSYQHFCKQKRHKTEAITINLYGKILRILKSQNSLS